MFDVFSVQFAKNAVERNFQNWRKQNYREEAPVKGLVIYIYFLLFLYNKHLLSLKLNEPLKFFIFINCMDPLLRRLCLINWTWSYRLYWTGVGILDSLLTPLRPIRFFSLGNKKYRPFPFLTHAGPNWSLIPSSTGSESGW